MWFVSYRRRQQVSFVKLIWSGPSCNRDVHTASLVHTNSFHTKIYNFYVPNSLTTIYVYFLVKLVLLKTIPLTQNEVLLYNFINDRSSILQDRNTFCRWPMSLRLHPPRVRSATVRTVLSLRPSAALIRSFHPTAWPREHGIVMTVNVGMLKLYVNCSKRTHADEEIKRNQEWLKSYRRDREEQTWPARPHVKDDVGFRPVIKQANLRKETQKNKIQCLSTLLSLFEFHNIACEKRHTVGLPLVD